MNPAVPAPFFFAISQPASYHASFEINSALRDFVKMACCVSFYHTHPIRNFLPARRRFRPASHAQVKTAAVVLPKALPAPVLRLPHAPREETV